MGKADKYTLMRSIEAKAEGLSAADLIYLSQVFQRAAMGITASRFYEGGGASEEESEQSQEAEAPRVGGRPPGVID